MSLQERIDRLPYDCSEMIYKLLFYSKYKDVLQELKSEMTEYWWVVGQSMYDDEEYLQRHRRVPEPVPPIVDGDYDYNEAITDYLNDYDEFMCEENYLHEVEDRNAYTYFALWMQGLRPCYYANEEYVKCLKSQWGFN